MDCTSSFVLLVLVLTLDLFKKNLYWLDIGMKGMKLKKKPGFVHNMLSFGLFKKSPVSFSNLG